jgi:cbb3-type cytochrome oxidase maturation protein
MTGVAILLPIALLMGLLGLGAFFWALKRGQFDDLEGAANRILIDEERDGADEDKDKLKDKTP